MNVLVYNRVGFVKYIPLTKSFGVRFDFNINEKIMPPGLLKKLKNFMRKQDNNREAGPTLPIGINKGSAKRAGCRIIVMKMLDYESKKDEVN